VTIDPLIGYALPTRRIGGRRYSPIAPARALSANARVHVLPALPTMGDASTGIGRLRGGASGGV